MKKKMTYCVIVVLFVGNVFQFLWYYPGIKTQAVPNAETAVLIAKTILGEEVAPEYCPIEGYSYWTFDVSVDTFRNAWVVEGYPPNYFEKDTGFMLKTVSIPQVVIRIRDARIISIRYLNAYM